MAKRLTSTILTFLLISWFMVSCSKEESIELNNLMQIKDVGMREGVFIRRYKLTSDYGKQQEFTPAILKKFIKEKLEPNYLFVTNAYDLGFHEENSIARKIKDYRVNLIANNHPFNYESFNIPQKTLQDFYQKKSVVYDIDLVRANSYSMADSVYKFLLTGNKLELPKTEEGLHFPQYIQYTNITYGEKLTPDLVTKLDGMKVSQVCKPFATVPTWAIMRLNSKKKNKSLKSYDDMATELIKQMHNILKFENKEKLINDLKEKYPVSIDKEYYTVMISAYKFKENQGWIYKDKIDESELDATFLSINNDEISLSSFISSFTGALQSMRSPVLTEQDIDAFVETYISQNLLYHDALEKGADQDVFIQDKLVNKEHKLLLTQYLNKEIAQKVVVSDGEVRIYYDNNRDKWTAAFEDVEKRVVYELRNTRLYERKNDLTEKLRNKYKVRYNEPLLEKLAQQLIEEKKGKTTTTTNP